MKKLDKTIIRETVYISIWVLIFSVLMQAVYLIISKWDYTVLLGNLLGDAAAILNFFLLGLTVQKVTGKEGDKVKATMRFSQVYRLLGMAAVIILGIVLPCFEMWSVIISAVLFARIAILIRPLFNNKMDRFSQSTSNNTDESEVEENSEQNESQI